MAEVRAFRGIRYDLGRVGSLADVIAPPYDVIDNALSQSLHEKHENNVIRLILDPIRPNDDESNNRYTRSAKTLRDWRTDGVLVEERDPAIYIYEQDFDWEGRTYTRRGFMARCRLEPFGMGNIHPHEETLSGPKADRLKLFHATGMNLSPIFGLFPDESGDTAECIAIAVRNKTPLEATDHLGVVHRMWPITDTSTIQRLQSMLSPKPLFIADGHHRYETGCRHFEDRKAAGLVSGPDDPANFILMMFVSMSDPGLRIMPTHRLVTGVGKMSAETLVRRLSPHFDCQIVGHGPEAGKMAWESIETGGTQRTLAFNGVGDDQWVLATLRSPESMDQVVADHSIEWKSLGVSILHRLALEKCLVAATNPSLTYVHLLSEVLDAVRRQSHDLACLVHPATLEDIRVLAGKIERMPAKSTYFYPKLASGLVLNPIR